MKQTENYQFKLIENTDSLSPEPINANTRAIEEKLLALAGGAVKVAVGSYAGDGASDPARTIAVGFTPKAVIVWGTNYTTSASGYRAYYSGMATADAPLKTHLVVTEGGFTVRQVQVGGYGEYPAMNEQNIIYGYLAIG